MTQILWDDLVLLKQIHCNLDQMVCNLDKASAVLDTVLACLEHIVGRVKTISVKKSQQFGAKFKIYLVET